MRWLSSFRKRQLAGAAASGPASVDLMTLGSFTPRAQMVLALACDEAARLQHNFVGTEHVLLGLVRLGQGTAVTVLEKSGCDLEIIRAEVERMVGPGPDQQLPAAIPYTPRVKKALALASREARRLNHAYVGTEHILLGLLREADGVAGRVLVNLGVELETVRLDVLKELDPNAMLESLLKRPGRDGPEPIDTSQRYDVYCTEGVQNLVVYRNVLFRSVKTLFDTNPRESSPRFLEIEQMDGQTAFIPLDSLARFCKPGATPGPELISDGGP